MSLSSINDLASRVWAAQATATISTSGSSAASSEAVSSDFAQLLALQLSQSTLNLANLAANSNASTSNPEAHTFSSLLSAVTGNSDTSQLESLALLHLLETGMERVSGLQSPTTPTASNSLSVTEAAALSAHPEK